MFRLPCSLGILSTVDGVSWDLMSRRGLGVWAGQEQGQGQGRAGVGGRFFRCGVSINRIDGCREFPVQTSPLGSGQQGTLDDRSRTRGINQ